MKCEEENQEDQDSHMDADIEVKGSKSTVTVSWDKKNEEGEMDDSDKRTNASGQMTESGADAVTSTDDAPRENPETNMKQEMQEPEESQMDASAGGNESTPTVTVTWEKKNEEGERDDVKKKSKGVNRKRKDRSTVETSPPKKTKLINDGFCLFVGNLNNAKTFEEVKDSLATYFMTQSLLVQDIRLDRSKKHAHVDLASEMDLTKALTLNGETVLDKPMKIDKAKVKSEDTLKVKASAEDKKATRDGRCLFLKNVPYSATKKDIMKIFRKAVAVRFPGGSESPNTGIAFVEFKNKTIAKKVQQKKRVAKIQDRVLIVDLVGEANVSKDAKAKDGDNNNNTTTKAPAPPNNTLFVSNLSYNVKEKKLKNVFQKAVRINVPQSKGKPRGYAFVEFASVADAEKALKSTQKMKICKREVRVEFFEMREKAKVESKTLIVTGLAEKTTAETLKSAFEGALSARVPVDKETGVSKRFGFVEFASEENCSAVRQFMEDCEIDGSKVTLAYAKPKGKKDPPRARGGLAGRPGGQPAGQRAGRGGRKDRGGRGSGGGRGRGADKLQAAVKEAGNKG
ncbi:nucleolin-like isoform X2 [Chelmon rostratus]|nr:nucleolin-like isoform X2 [Chelmon rostratus]